MTTSTTFLPTATILPPLLSGLALISITLGILTACTPNGPVDTDLSPDGNSKLESFDGIASELPTMTKLPPLEAKVSVVTFKHDAPFGGDNTRKARETTDTEGGKDKENKNTIDKSLEKLNNIQTGTAKLRFPKIDLKHEGSNFVMILRCPANPGPPFKREFYISNQGKMDPQKFFDTYTFESNSLAQQQYKFFWLAATKHNTSGCVFVGTHIARTEIFDLAAPTGRWYYLINPCVSEAFSQTSQEDCSHRVIQTEPFDFVSDVDTEFVNKVSDLVKIEHELIALGGRMQPAAVEIAVKLENCEAKAAVDAHNKSIDNFWQSFSVGALLALAGFILGGAFGVPSLTVRAFTLGVQWGSDGLSPIQRYAKQVSKQCQYLTANMEAFSNMIDDANELRVRAVGIQAEMNAVEGRYPILNAAAIEP